jgi:hypothetical protein
MVRVWMMVPRVRGFRWFGRWCVVWNKLERMEVFRQITGMQT